ncbi:hypothetical protein NQZ68_017583 [Dissostichus eleginoides]|nr:hypothetical protein NQZ68_017583 [Dissostichus eleginoides]
MRTWRRGLGGAITRIQEKREAGKNPTDFVAKLLQETLGLEKEPLLDRSHRTLRERPQEDQPPLCFVDYNGRWKATQFHRPGGGEDFVLKNVAKQSG